MSTRFTGAELLFPAAHLLAESPMWLPETDELACVDIDAGDVLRIDPAHPLAARRSHVGDWVSAIVPAGDGRLVAMTEAGACLLSADDNVVNVMLPAEGLGEHRYNDAKLDRSGRLLFSTILKTSPRTPTGEICGFDGSTRRTLLGGIRTPNSICFSPDGRTLYACDTAIGAIWRFDYADDGTVGEKAEFVPVDIGPGKPDGATVDADGCLWSARYNGGAVLRITPEGRVDRIVRLPVQQITSCTFGGPGLDTLFITTARQNLTATQLAEQPLAGSIFAVQPGVTGLPEPYFVGTSRPTKTPIPVAPEWTANALCNSLEGSE
jgi:sugar lactone lactonase YvrE